MTMPADPAVFDPTKRLRTATTTQQPSTSTPMVAAAPTPPSQILTGPTTAPISTGAPPIFTTDNPTPPNNPDLDPTTGQPRQVSTTAPGVQTIRNSDGSAVVTQNGQIVQRIDANGQVTTGAPPQPAPSTGLGTAGVQPAGSTTPQWIQQPDGSVRNTQTGEIIPAGQSQSGLPAGAIYQDSTGKVWLKLANGGIVPYAGSNTQAVQGAGTFGANTTIASTGDANLDAAINNAAILNRTQAQTSGDIARISSAGATAQNDLTNAANTAQGVGNQIYQDAQTARLEALARGDTGLSLSQTAGTAAQNTAANMAAPLAGLGNYEQALGANARTDAAANLADANARLGTTDATVARLEQLAAAGDPAATAQLAAFQGSAGTAGALGAFNAMPTTNLGGFQGSAGNAAGLEGLNTTTPETAALSGFQGTAGTAGALQNVNTRAAATGNLMGFTGNQGTAPQLAGVDTTAAGLGNLSNFQGTGGLGLAELERLGQGADIGPSAAEALLRKGYDTTLGQNIALARSGRGAGENASAMRQALFTNAATGQQEANDLAALRAQEAATQRGQNISAAQAAAGTSATLSGQNLAAKQAVVEAQNTAVSNKIQALVSSGAMSQKQADQVLSAMTNAQTGQLQASEQQINALVASGQMSQAQAAQVLDAMKAAQTAQTAATAQRSANLATAGQQRQVQAQQQLDALRTQQQSELQASQQRLDALVASGQMTQKQADQQLAALQSAQQGQLASETNRINAAQAAGTTATQAAGVSADLAKAFATLGLQYDVNSGQVFNQAGQLVQGGDKIAADLLSTGLGNQAQQGQVGASLAANGAGNLAALTQTSTDARKAAALLGPTTAAQIAGLSQAQLAELDNIVSRENKQELEMWAAVNGLNLSNDQMQAQQTGAIFGAIGTLVGGIAGLAAGGPAGAAVGATAGGALGSQIK